MKKSLKIGLVVVVLIGIVAGGGLYFWFTMNALPDVTGAKVLFLLTSDFRYNEYLMVANPLRGHGAVVTIASFQVGTIFGDGGSVESQITFDNVVVDSYQAIYVPGGWSPYYLADSNLSDVRTRPAYNSANYAAISKVVLDIIREAKNKGLVVGAMCHGPLLLATAGILNGVRATGNLDPVSGEGVEQALKDGGAIIVGTTGSATNPAVRDGLIITAGHEEPSFPKPFMEAIAEKLG